MPSNGHVEGGKTTSFILNLAQFWSNCLGLIYNSCRREKQNTGNPKREIEKKEAGPFDFFFKKKIFRFISFGLINISSQMPLEIRPAARIPILVLVHHTITQ